MFSNSFACLNISEAIDTKIRDLVKSSYPSLKFSELKVSNVDTKLINQCDSAKFTMPKKVNLKNDLIVKFDLFEGDLFKKRITKIYRFSGQAQVLRAVKPLENGNIANESTLKKDNISISSVSYRTISDIGSKQMQFRNYINKGEVIEDWMIEVIPDVKKGEIIKAIVKKDNITLTLDGRVLENGNIGSKIKLQLNDKIIIGKLYDEKTVIINNI